MSSKKAAKSMEEVAVASKAAAEDDSESSDDDYGPMQAPSTSGSASAANETAAADAEEEAATLKRKRPKKTLEFEKVYLDRLPTSDTYECSYMHRDTVTHVGVSKNSEFIITASLDGHVKFWKKMAKTIEFVKHYQAHIGSIAAFVISPDEKMLVTTGASDQMIKFFEISGFDMSNMISVEYQPFCACWIPSVGSSNRLCNRVAVADQNSGNIRIYRISGDQQAMATLDLHSSPVKCMALNFAAQAVVSIDSRGVIEYWDCQTLQLPPTRKAGQRDTAGITFTLKTDTDLYDLAKARASPLALSIAPKGDFFAVLSSDMMVRIFNFARGKLSRKYDESVAANVQSMSGSGPGASGMDKMELSRRQAVERELESLPDSLSLSTLVYDESGHFLLLGSMVGIKVLNLVTNKVSRILGSSESGERFLCLALYQGVPRVDAQLLLSRVGDAGDSGMTKTVEEMEREKAPLGDPTVFASSFKKKRFYCLSNRQPNEAAEGRDKLNEMPEEEDRQGLEDRSAGKNMSTEVVLHTTMGSIHLRLFAQECPKTIENFTTHVRNKYYDNITFHRVIKGFMVQTGDPLGDGTGGDSIWGREFEDEFVKSLRHDRPYTVSMANAGPNTNGSQFFITCAPTPWLDNKHTVFGRVTKGFDVITKIENLKVGKLDRPFDEVRIISAEAL